MTLLAIAARLSEAGIRFVLIGGLAMRAQGSARLTEDLDICYDPGIGWNVPDHESGRLAEPFQKRITVNLVRDAQVSAERRERVLLD